MDHTRYTAFNSGTEGMRPAKPSDPLVLQLHDGLHGPVVVVEVDGAHHLGALQVADLHRHLADGVAADQLHHLLGGSVARVHLDGGQLDVLWTKRKED